ncbi:MAG: alpha/beta hydrolase [Bacteroidales bacterium]
MEKRVKINGVDFNYSVEGEGAPVVLMHGWGCNLTTLNSVAALLVNDFKVYNVDFPGFGSSSEPTEVWGVEEYTQLIERWCELEGIMNPVMLGHSFGGRVGILFSSRNSVDKLILVDAAGVKPKRPLKYYLKVYSYKCMKRVLFTFLGKVKGAEILAKYAGGAGSADYKSASMRMRAILSKVVNEDLRSEMPKIKASTLLVWGENDTATPVGDAKVMESLIADSGLVVFPNVGHYSFLDNPRGFAAVIKSFLNIDKK